MHRPGNNRHQRGRGFTFIEVLAALLFLAILVPAIVGGLTISNRASVISERSALAAELAENQLNEELIGSNWASAATNAGDFGEGYPGYRWEMTQTTWQGDTTNIMTQLTMEVFFPVQGHEHSVRLTTLVNPSTVASSQGTTQSGTGTGSTLAK